ncbi:hypothetical protein RDWZM_000565 [Blomia tropicalis]|uniref:PDZ domain-containing protein n=1 Tax=Blomia tropicalis TaxID=40697 RepID=A0A9Q0ME05_BLOTA|nr:hypothetical protein RDWZM_000565 [Blomia tropicalis]
MVKGTSQCDPTKWKCDSSTELAHFITGSYKLLPPTSFSFNLNGDDDSRLFNRQSKYSSRSRLRSSQYSAHHNGRKLNYYSSTIAFSLDRLSDFYDERNVITVRGGGVVNCGGRGHKGGLRVHDEIIAVNNFELDNHPLTLHRQPDSKSEEADLDQLTKLDFTYQLIKHTLNRQLQLTVRRWHSDWELAPHIFFPLSSSTHGDDSEGEYSFLFLFLVSIL